MSLFKGTRRSTKWIIIFLLGFINICLLTGAYLYYLSVKERILYERSDDLQTITTLKINQIEQWFNERLSELKYFPANKNFVFHTKKLIVEKNDIKLQNYFLSRFQRLRDNHKYKNILITSLNGRVLFTLDSTQKKVDSFNQKFLRRENKSKEIWFTDFYYCKYHNEIHYDILSPVIDENSSIIAYVIFKVNPNDYLYPLIQEWPVPSKSAETLIFRKGKDRIILLNKLRYIDNSKLSFSIPLSRKDILAVKGALGESGIIEGKDYRNVDVIGDICHIPGTDWYMIAKMDMSDIYNELGYVTILFIIIIVFVILLIGSGIIYIYKYRQSNLYKEMYLKEKILNETTEEFGTSLYSIGDGVITTDISGQIVRMNPVAESLTGWKENEAKGLHINKVFNIIDEKSGDKIEFPVQIIAENSFTKRSTTNTLLISRSKRQIPVVFSISSIKNGKNKINGTVLVFMDESKKRITKNLLMESEARFSSIFHNSPIGISISELDGKMIDVNDLFLESTGYSRDEIIGKTPLEIGFYRNTEDREKLVGAILKDGYVPKMEIDFRMKSGEIKTCL